MLLLSKLLFILESMVLISGESSQKISMKRIEALKKYIDALNNAVSIGTAIWIQN